MTQILKTNNHSAKPLPGMAEVNMETIPLRIRIGVTGHRSLSDEATLAEQIREALSSKIFELFDDKSRAIIGATKQTPIAFSILSPLAEGADRLVVKEVLKCENRDPRLEVVLPLAKEDYLQDFASAESRQEFEELINKARRPVTLREKKLAEELTQIDFQEARRQAYENVGRYIVDNCDVLLALWDGQESRGRGGTAEIVNYAKVKNRPIIHILTLAPYNISVLPGDGLNAMSIHNIELFNTFPVSEEAKQVYISNVFNSLFNNPEGEQLSAETKRTICEKLLPFYVKASIIAKFHQKFYQRAGLLIYSFSALAVAAVALAILVHEWAFHAFSFEFLLLLVIFLTVVFADRKGTHKKWIENRFLAERIRSSIFFAACGVEISPIRIPQHMLIAHRPDDWMVKVFHDIWNRLPAMVGCQGQQCRIFISYIRKHWLQDQIDYHKNKAKKAKKISSALETAGKIAFFSAMTAALFHVLLLLLGAGFHAVLLDHSLSFIALVMPAVGAAIGGIRTHREYSRLEKRSYNMSAALEELNRRFSNVRGPEELERILRDIEELMLRETQDWLMLMRFVKLEAAA